MHLSRQTDRLPTEDSVHSSAATTRAQSTTDYGCAAYQYKREQTLRSFMVENAFQISRNYPLHKEKLYLQDSNTQVSNKT